MIEIAHECLHAPPERAGGPSPCCGRKLEQLPPYDRLVLDPEQVTCGRLSTAEQMLLSGQPVVLDPDHEQVMFSMASTVCSLSGGTVTLPHAFAKVNDAIRELLPRDKPLPSWSAAMMVAVTSRAQSLSLL